uniref:Uncharacterized protein n=1 Tax=Chromera velia CCMP2878 TaxID=1169474 RepID=A0A0G4HKA0_9ALVE|eukprot:Cvel_7194.t2-p1 / transcript=Cvel_7194.t2 / gene=Cvel_7194 / organism=Chromera_velia_CCMP2878 / gene_product=hypothetical protein / transcript_product=hypothetical protein / location=Cvel_scaffold370:19611-35693(-) / protein_length=1259 / sequence_SO=supercontig / SO=protein_coding / is_pseudo=false
MSSPTSNQAETPKHSGGASPGDKDKEKAKELLTLKGGTVVEPVFYKRYLAADYLRADPSSVNKGDPNDLMLPGPRTLKNGPAQAQGTGPEGTQGGKAAGTDHGPGGSGKVPPLSSRGVGDIAQTDTKQLQPPRINAPSASSSKIRNPRFGKLFPKLVSSDNVVSPTSALRDHTSESPDSPRRTLGGNTGGPSSPFRRSKTSALAGGERSPAEGAGPGLAPSLTADLRTPQPNDELLSRMHRLKLANSVRQDVVTLAKKPMVGDLFKTMLSVGLNSQDKDAKSSFSPLGMFTGGGGMGGSGDGGRPPDAGKILAAASSWLGDWGKQKMVCFSESEWDRVRARLLRLALEKQELFSDLKKNNQALSTFRQIGNLELKLAELKSQQISLNRDLADREAAFAENFSLRNFCRGKQKPQSPLREPVGEGDASHEEIPMQGQTSQTNKPSATQFFGDGCLLAEDSAGPGPRQADIQGLGGTERGEMEDGDAHGGGEDGGGAGGSGGAGMSNGMGQGIDALAQWMEAEDDSVRGKSAGGKAGGEGGEGDGDGDGHLHSRCKQSVLLVIFEVQSSSYFFLDIAVLPQLDRLVSCIVVRRDRLLLAPLTADPSHLHTAAHLSSTSDFINKNALGGWFGGEEGAEGAGENAGEGTADEGEGEDATDSSDVSQQGSPSLSASGRNEANDSGTALVFQLERAGASSSSSGRGEGEGEEVVHGDSGGRGEAGSSSSSSALAAVSGKRESRGTTSNRTITFEVQRALAMPVLKGKAPLRPSDISGRKAVYSLVKLTVAPETDELKISLYEPGSSRYWTRTVSFYLAVGTVVDCKRSRRYESEIPESTLRGLLKSLSTVVEASVSSSSSSSSSAPLTTSKDQSEKDKDKPSQQGNEKEMGGEGGDVTASITLGPTAEGSGMGAAGTTEDGGGSPSRSKHGDPTDIPPESPRAAQRPSLTQQQRGQQQQQQPIGGTKRSTTLERRPISRRDELLTALGVSEQTLLLVLKEISTHIKASKSHLVSLNDPSALLSPSISLPRAFLSSEDMANKPAQRGSVARLSASGPPGSRSLSPRNSIVNGAAAATAQTTGKKDHAAGATVAQVEAGGRAAQWTGLGEAGEKKDGLGEALLQDPRALNDFLEDLSGSFSSSSKLQYAIILLLPPPRRSRREMSVLANKRKNSVTAGFGAGNVLPTDPDSAVRFSGGGLKETRRASNQKLKAGGASSSAGFLAALGGVAGESLSLSGDKEREKEGEGGGEGGGGGGSGEGIASWMG